jgi:hypothetical protein
MGFPKKAAERFAKKARFFPYQPLLLDIAVRIII